MKQAAIDFLEVHIHLETKIRDEWIVGSEPYNAHQKEIEICRWLIGILQGGLGHSIGRPGGSDEEEWIRIK